jgi:hypothetical protein
MAMTRAKASQITTKLGSTGTVRGLDDKLAESVSVKDFGADPTGVADSTAAIQNAHNTGKNVYYPRGSYTISAAIEVVPGQRAYGDKGSRWANTDNRSRITQLANNTPVFQQTASVLTFQESGFSSEDLMLVSDEGIRLNDLTTTISTGGPSPFLMNSTFRRVAFKSKTNGVGIGLSMAKCFDFVIDQCDFDQHARSLIMQGCDLGRVQTNRFTSFHEYAILDLSTGTFGSQTLIENNDIVQAANAAAVFIKTTNRHVRIVDNYLEQQSGNITGFIDASSTGVPVYGANAVSSTRYASVVIERNRIDGHHLATSFIYRYEPGTSSFAKICDVGTNGTAPAGGVGTWLTVVNDYLTPRVNVTNMSRYEIEGGRGEDGFAFNYFKSKPLSRTPSGIYFDAESFCSLDRGQLDVSSAVNHVRLSSIGIILLPTLSTTVLRCVLPVVNGVNNVFLKNGVNYTVKVTARTMAGTETLRTSLIVDGAASGANTDMSLTTQNDTFTFTAAGQLSTVRVGLRFVNISGGGFVNNIVIESVSIEEA